MMQKSFYRWLIISIFVGASFLMIPRQLELWPFSCFPMFNTRFDLIQKDHMTYQLLGARQGKDWIEIRDARILGAIHPAMIRTYIRHKINDNQGRDLKEALLYWKFRYRKVESELAPPLKGLTEFAVMTTIYSDGKIPENRFDWKIQL